MQALIIVDIQNDFLPGGALAAPDGNAVIPVANAAIRSAKDAGSLVVATRDFHPADHGSFASQHADRSVGQVIQLDGLNQTLWPDHCVQGSEGAEFPEELRTELIDRVFPKGEDPRVDSYSGFFDNDKRRSTGLGEYLRECGVTSVKILGLATDYCVKYSALDAIAEGFETTLLIDGCRGIDLNPGDVNSAIEEMRAMGVHITTSKEIKQC